MSTEATESVVGASLLVMSCLPLQPEYLERVRINYSEQDPKRALVAAVIECQAKLSAKSVRLVPYARRVVNLRLR